MKDEIKHALRLAKAFGGMTYAANNVASGMSDGGTLGRPNYQMGGGPMGAPNMMGMPGMMPQDPTMLGQSTINTGLPQAATLDANLPPPQPTQAPVPGMPMNTMSGANPAGLARGGAAIWNKPRPKSLGKPKHLSPAKKSKAKAMAKAAGRPYPNMIDNMRAARDAGGAVEDALRLAKDGKYRLHQTIARQGYATDGSVEGSVTQQPDYEREDVGNILTDLESRAAVNQTVQQIQGMTPPERIEAQTTPPAHAQTTPHTNGQATPPVPSPEIEDYARMGLTPPAEGELRGPMSTLRPGELTSHGSTDMRAHYQWTPKHNAVDETLQMMRQKHADGGEVKRAIRLAKKSKNKRTTSGKTK